jgi:hypothetical protein
MRGSADGEDVLSSVLRLASEDLRVPGRAPVSPSEAMLVLTPDQRIDAPAQPPVADPGLVPKTASAALPGVTDEALREMVRAVLREELHGPFGERITRSVRKLVMAEMHRVLATRDGE